MSTLAPWLASLMFAGILFCPHQSKAQPASSVQTTELHSLDLPLYRGRAYHGHPQSYEGSAFILSTNFQLGALHYRGVDYDSVSLNYDALLRRLVVKHPGQIYPIQLESRWVKEFSVAGRRFVNYGKNEEPRLLEILAEAAEIRFYSEPLRKLIKQAEADRLRQIISVEDRYYLELEGTLHPIQRKKDLFKLLAPYKKELKAYYRAEGLNFRKQPRESLLALAQKLQEIQLQP